jgi:hypothetical protein
MKEEQEGPQAGNRLHCQLMESLESGNVTTSDIDLKRLACHSFQVLDGDLILLQGQEVLTFQQASARAGLVDIHSSGSDGQNGAGGHGNGASEEDLTGLEDRRYFMPTKSDRPIKAFREWVKEFGNGGPRWPAGFRTVPDVLGERPEVILDRFTQVSAADTELTGA